MPSIEEIMSGKDISKHYLGEKSDKFKIFRFKNGVYAVRFNEDQSKPPDFIQMWVSHKGEGTMGEPEPIGRGLFGVVNKKTTDKAVKTLSGASITPEDGVENNLAILEQQFLLKDHHIDEYFILGLWNIKNKGNVVFNMPYVEGNIHAPKEKIRPQFDEFILALKQLNELGYAHPDLANSYSHSSFQNMIISESGVRLIDLDKGLWKYNEGQYQAPLARDQWIYVYNHQFSNRATPWKIALKHWYDKHPDQPISENPQALLKLYNNGWLSLPTSLVRDMHLKNTEVGVEEYQAGSTVNRVHTFHEASAEDLGYADDFKKIKEEFMGIKGDALKRVIIKELKDSLESIDTLEDLARRKLSFYDSPKMKILDIAQGKTTSILGPLGLKTSSHDAVAQLFKDAEKRIQNQERNSQKL
ncbi:hypothetical protein [Legionella waltersii]|uniref:Dot/Icm T4SS effector n=1 Tax=Legionella waltersii TaxID=66969 RepID=A0A0W1AD05_9GAMM|nr:hypothetical protein [Legionella waltersii]KTD79234.1 Dot/Icm T4SS effector [Legionella waltersii]SNV12654.1 Dot/Icm T4SS effector [Legionella waltersii]